MHKSIYIKEKSTVMGRLYKKKFRIPGYDQNFVPNGLEFCQDMELYLISGHIKSGKAARIYVVEPDGKYRCKDIFISKNKQMKCHNCGIARSGNMVYITCSDGNCYVMKIDELLRRDTSEAHVFSSFKTGNRASFCCMHNGFLYIGEHSHKSRIDSASHMFTPGGEHNSAVINAFRLNEAVNIGVLKHPEFAFSIQGKVRGMTFSEEGHILLLISKKIVRSYIYIYDCQTAFQIIKNELSILGRTVTVYYLDKLSQKELRRCMPGTQDIAINNQIIYLLTDPTGRLPVLKRLTGAEYLKFSAFRSKL